MDYDALKAVDGELEEVVLYQAVSSLARFLSVVDTHDVEAETDSISTETNIWDEKVHGVQRVVLPRQYDEFICEACSLIHHQSRKSQASPTLCTDCYQPES